MAFRTAARDRSRFVSRAAGGIALASVFVILASDGLQNAIANGDTRTLSFHNLHTQEDLTVTFKRNGRYDSEALKKINHILRDWRRDEQIGMDPHLLDTVWEVYREVGGKEAIHIICGYRAPHTNAMLRRRSSGVAQFSQHTQGKALDFMIPGVPLEELRHAGLRLQRGGVGFYPSSGSPFVHVDVGSVRHWPRMTHDQLVKVFPDGRTVHVPSDGQPLKNYALALADLEKRGATPSATSLEAAKSAGVSLSPKQNIFAKLFGFGKKQDEEEEPDVTATPEPAPAAAPARQKLALVRPAVAEPAPPAVPMPKSRPANIQVVAVQPVTPETPAPAATYALAGAGNDLFAARGYWRGMQETQGDAQPTASIGPWNREALPGEVALGYAPPVDPKSEPKPARAPAMGQASRRAIAPATTVAVKGSTEAPTVVESSFPGVLGAVSSHSDSPWLKAVILTPSVAAYLNTTLLGAPDYRHLQPLLRKPSAVLAMTFSDRPNPGLDYQRFSGAAVTFLASVAMNTRSASLR